MRIISWNVHFDITEEQYKHIKEKSPDILIIEECHTKGFELVQKDWKNALFYNDQLYENPTNDKKNMYGIAIFSNKYHFEFTDNFNRNLRYVVPFKISYEESRTFLFNLFVVWTKKEPYNYLANFIQAFEFPGYSEYLKERAMFIGDFNTPATKEKRESYDKILNLGLIDCAKTEDILKPTYSHAREVNFYTADYCFVNEALKNTSYFTVDETIFDFDINYEGKDKYKGLSDHVPLQIDINFALPRSCVVE